MTDLNVPNRTLFHGDNLPFLRGLNSESVHLIATDPPFNKGRDFHATPDSLARGAKFQDRWKWDDDVQGEWVDQITDDWPKVMNVINGVKEGYGEGLAAFLCFMAVRLIEMHRVLRSDGSIYLHCDPTASHYLKALMDAIFGQEHFRNEIVWKRSHAHSSAKRFGPIHDIILFYSKSHRYVWTDPRRDYDSDYVERYFKFDDGDGRGRYWTGDLTGSGIRQGETGTPWRGFNPTEKGRHWMNPPRVLDELDSDGRIYWPKTKGAWPKLKRYHEEAKGLPLQDIVDDVYALQTMGGSKRERVGYPTQKPLALYERIISASSNEGDVVLDPFAGCATTPIAAERLGRQWVGADIWDGALEVVKQRMEDNRQLLREPNPQINFITEPPERTDDAEEAVPFLQVTERFKEPAGPRMTRQEMFDHLIAQNGQRCQGCDRAFDDPRYLQLDHNTPRADGGINHITNRVLLCGPCNMLKSNIYTLSGLRRENAKRGYMAR